MISDHLLKVPRLIWSLLGGGGAIIAAVAGRDHLQQVMADFLNVIAYWLSKLPATAPLIICPATSIPLTPRDKAPFLAIMFLEHMCFRRGYAYDIGAWNDPKKLPYGFAAFAVFCIGTVLAVLCMSQAWWVGPIALAVGNPPYGTDISWELALGATVLLFVPLRWVERWVTGF
ncbi:hypothetical protein LTR66_014205 [Elasticomyces elasticus]|nr:hypothetical protein LTR28_012361 [Elasticomyces elasticus]KAK4947279.1 hypothetical protein LTR66_014205 [Elasticomyces elasticus]